MANVVTNKVACVCQSDEYTVLYPAGVAQVNQIVRCNRCGMMYANPRARPDIEHILEYAHDPNWDVARELPHIIDKQALQVRDYEGTKAYLNKLYPNRGRLLEVGSSMGFLLDFFKKDGWEVSGVEPDHNAAGYATKRLGIPTSATALEDAGIPDESMDVVLLMHVIEHVPDPVQTLTEIRRILKPGGHLVLETPRYDTLMFKLLGRRERSLRCEGHIWFFTTRSLRETYERVGFETMRLNCVGRSMTLERLLHNVGIVTRIKPLQMHDFSVTHGDGSNRFLARTSRRLNLNKVRLHLNFRDIQRVVVRKPTTPATPPA